MDAIILTLLRLDKIFDLVSSQQTQDYILSWCQPNSMELRQFIPGGELAWAFVFS